MTKKKNILKGLCVALWINLGLGTLVIAEAFADVQKLTILFTNDHHGRYLKNGQGEYGMAARKTLIDRLRAEAKKKDSEVLLLSGGDINTGTPESDALDAKPDFIGMNELGYDAMALGNHEFDKPLEVLFRQKKLAKFPFLSANIIDREKSAPLFREEGVYEKTLKNGLKVILVGFTTYDTRTYLKAEKKKRIEVRDPIAVAKELLPQLARRDHDIIIAMTHMGHYPKGQHGDEAPGDISLARALQKGQLDLIVGGHTQKPLLEVQKHNGTYIVQAGEWGKYVGRLELEFSSGGNFVVKSHELIPVNLREETLRANGDQRSFFKRIPEDQDLLARLETFTPQVEVALEKKTGLRVKLDEVLAKLDQKFWGRPEAYRNRAEETYLGRLMSESFCAEMKSDVCFTNMGSLRVDLDKGPVTYREALELMPFRGKLCRAKMKVGEFVSYLKERAKNRSWLGGHHFSGLRMTVQGKILKSVELVKRAGTKLRNTVLWTSDQGLHSEAEIEEVHVASTCYAAKRFVNVERFTQLFKKFDVLDIAAFVRHLKSLGDIRGQQYDRATLVKGPVKE